MARHAKEVVAERELPLLPLYPHVLLPAGMLTVTIAGNNPLIKHLAHASGPDTLVAAVPYDPAPEREDEDISGQELVLDHDRLFHTGTAARVAQLLKDSKTGQWTLALEGLHRLSINNVTSADAGGHGPWFVTCAQLDHFGGNSATPPSPSPGAEAVAEEAALSQRLVAQTRQLTLRLQGRQRGTEAARRIARVLVAAGPERMTDTLGSLVARTRADRLLVLGTLDRLERMRLVSSQLERVLRALAQRAQQSASTPDSTPGATPNASPGAITGLGAARPRISPGAGPLALPGAPEAEEEAEDVDRVMARLAAARPPRAVLEVARREARRLGRTSEQSPGYAMSLAYLETLADLPWNRWSWQAAGDEAAGESGAAASAQPPTSMSGATSPYSSSTIGPFSGGASKAQADVEKSKGSSASAPATESADGTVSENAAAPPRAPTPSHAPAEPTLASVREALDAAHTGLEEVKRRIVEYVAVRRLRGWEARAPVLCLVGPPGVGKTSLAASVAAALGRPLQRIALGGVRDEAELRGHRRTYVGAMPGRVIKAVQKARVRDPLLLLDEVDKMGRDGHRGDPAAALLEILDPEQNAAFTDTYLALPFDLSPVLFVATANSAADIPAPLLDRMELVRLGGYTLDEKLGIARRHLVPRLLAEHGLTDRDVAFPDASLRLLAEGYTREAGVRGLSRAIATICRHVAAGVVEAEEKAGGGAVVAGTGATEAPDAAVAARSGGRSSFDQPTPQTLAPRPAADLDGVMVTSDVPAAGGLDLAALAGSLARPAGAGAARRRTSALGDAGAATATTGGALSSWLPGRRRAVRATQASTNSPQTGALAAPPAFIEEDPARIPRRPAPRPIARRRDANVHVTAELIERILKARPFEAHDAEHRVGAPGAAAGLVWTAAGGAVQYIECIATRRAGTGALALTGQLGDVLEESARIALSWVRARADDLGIAHEAVDGGDRKNASSPRSRAETWDVHVHLPAGGVPKDGPSAGITLAVALASLFLDRAARADVAMTGELTLRGHVLPIGGVKEKLLAAHAAGVKRVIVPRRNLRDIEAEVPASVRAAVEVVGVQRLEEVLAAAFDPPLTLAQPARL